MKSIKIKDTDKYCGDTLTLSHLKDTGKCHVMTSSYGEVTSASLNTNQVKKMINWLERWLKYKKSKANILLIKEDR